MDEKAKDTGEERTVFTAKHSDIERTGTKQCASHSWRLYSENELACTTCPTIIIVSKDDPRLLAL